MNTLIYGCTEVEIQNFQKEGVGVGVGVIVFVEMETSAGTSVDCVGVSKETVI